jgi:hypothetical protein
MNTNFLELEEYVQPEWTKGLAAVSGTSSDVYTNKLQDAVQAPRDWGMHAPAHGCMAIVTLNPS